MQNYEITNQHLLLMKFPFFSRIDYRIIIFIILMMLLPFLLFSAETKSDYLSGFTDMPLDSIGTDTSGIVVEYEIDSLDEAYPAIFSSVFFSLVSIPADSVYILATPDAQLDLGAGPGNAVQVLFPPYPIALSPHEIKVKPVDDAIYEGLHSGNISFEIVAEDPEYAVYSISDISYAIKDNDPLPGINFIYTVDTFLTEGLSGITMLLSLNSIPEDTVFITSDPDMQMRITALPDESVTLAFPPNASCLSFQAINIRAFDDIDYEGDHAGLLDMTVTTDDPVYGGFILDDVTFPIVDNDAVPGIDYADPDTLALNEGSGEIEISIALNSIPADTVTITFVPDLQLRIAAGPGEAYDLKLPPNSTALNPHLVSVKAYDDVDYEGPHTGTVNFIVTTSDADYAGFTIDPITIDITDNDFLPAVLMNDTTALAGVEGDTTLFFTLALNSVPLATVTINMDPDAQLDLGKGRDIDVNYKFKGDSALIAQTVNIAIYDDVFVEGFHLGKIGFSIMTDDPNYILFTLDTVVVEITDNDGVSIINYDPGKWNVFPTVSNANFSYAMAGISNSDILHIYNGAGMMVQQIQISSENGILYLEKLPAGAYTIVAELNGMHYYSRIEIVR